MVTFGNLETDVEPLASLMRDHLEVYELVEGAREAVERALAAPDDAAAGIEALETLRDLDAYLAVDLTIHIAKEEDVLFPALRGFAAELDKVVDEMVEQHDEVRARRAALERALAAADHGHDDVVAERERLSAGLAANGASTPSPKTLEELLDGVKRLDWILQGHFGDEEDDLFPPALDLLSQEKWEELAEQARALDT